MAPDPIIIYRRHAVGLDLPADGVAIILDHDGNALVHADGTPRFPFLSEVRELAGQPAAQAPAGSATAAPAPPAPAAGPEPVVHQIATWNGRPVFLAPSPGTPTADPAGTAGTPPVPTPALRFTRGTFRSLYGGLGEVELGLLGRAMQVAHWADTSRFCSRCGTPTRFADDECVATCPSCGYGQYPRLAPAMIVGVVRDGRILLAQSPRFRGVLHSILAGFVEPGESVEECVHREVFEETGIRVNNVRYFGSQSWPFPHSLMLGFTAEYAGGEITVDPRELVHADWYSADALPEVPSELSISGRIIRWFREEYGDDVRAL